MNNSSKRKWINYALSQSMGFISLPTLMLGLGLYEFAMSNNHSGIMFMILTPITWAVPFIMILIFSYRRFKE